MTASRKEVAAEEAANGRFNGNLSASERPHFLAAGPRPITPPAPPTLARPNAVLTKPTRRPLPEG
jgi:hypothetical protein